MAFSQDTAINTLWYSSTADEVPDSSDPAAAVVKHGAVAVNTNDGMMWINIQGGDVSGGWELVSGSISIPVSVANGGTGATSFSDKAVAITQASGTDTLSSVAMSTNGQLLIGGTSGPTAATLTAGSNITVTNGNGTVTVAATDTNTVYSGWTIVDSQVPPNSELVLSAASVAFHGGGGISNTYSPATNTMVINYSSSERYKENIADITFDTSKIFNLAPRSFTWRATSGNGLQGTNDFGLIAEEVNEIIPELIFNNPDDEIQGIKLSALVTMLLVEMKKLKARVTVLEAG